MNILTDEEIQQVRDSDLYIDFYEVARAIEAAVLEKIKQHIGYIPLPTESRKEKP
jgi:hypothetical protein